jgi:4a-hydroxytetrahydrobiopterin dehydratase
MSGPGLRAGTVDAMTDDGIRARTFHDAVGADGWRLVSDGANAFYPTTSLAQSAALVAALGGLESIDGHPPDIDIRPDGVTVKLLTVADDWYGPTQRDVDAARRISAVAAERGLVADPRTVASMLIIIGTQDPARVMPFWAAVLGYERRADSPDEDLVDPHGRGPAIWFETIDHPREEGGGIHLAVWLPPELAEARVEAALAAGGHLVRDTQAPTWWTLADGEGNEIDVSTVLHRD